MKKKVFIFFSSGLFALTAFGQETLPAGEDKPEKKWTFDAAANLYFLKDDFFVLPVMKADRGRLHLEGRYNYEDRNTASLWVGMNFHFGNEFKIDVTPMAGVIFGNTDGVSPGLELTMAYKRFELYSEGEFYLSTEDINLNYAYMWTDFRYSPTDWMSFGISGQRTRLYSTSVDVQRGIMASFYYKNASLTGYWYNIGMGSSSFAILAMGYGF